MAAEGWLVEPWFIVAGTLLVAWYTSTIEKRRLERRLDSLPELERAEKARGEAGEILQTIYWFLLGILLMLAVIADRIGGAF